MTVAALSARAEDIDIYSLPNIDGFRLECVADVRQQRQLGRIDHDPALQTHAGANVKVSSPEQGGRHEIGRAEVRALQADRKSVSSAT